MTSKQKEVKIKEMKKEAVKIDYPGNCISVNHYLGRRKGGGYYIKPETVVFKTELGWLLKHCHLETFQLPLHVTCDGFFKDNRSAPDLSNLSKVIMDTIQDLVSINDKEFRWHDGERIIGIGRPYLVITLSEPPPECPKTPPQCVSGRVKPESKGKGSAKKTTT